MAKRLAGDARRTVLGQGTVGCIVLDAAHFFVCRPIIDACVNALAGVLVREVLP